MFGRTLDSHNNEELRGTHFRDQPLIFGQKFVVNSEIRISKKLKSDANITLFERKNQQLCNRLLNTSLKIHVEKSENSSVLNGEKLVGAAQGGSGISCAIAGPAFESLRRKRRTPPRNHEWCYLSFPWRDRHLYQSTGIVKIDATFFATLFIFSRCHFHRQNKYRSTP